MLGGSNVQLSCQDYPGLAITRYYSTTMLLQYPLGNGLSGCLSLSLCPGRGRVELLRVFASEANSI